MKKISDYKFTTVWSGMNGLKEEWEQQLNLYHLLCVANGIMIEEMEIVAIYRDWQQRQSWNDPEYPKSQVEVFKVPMWAFTSAEGFLEDRVRLHQQARNSLPECTANDMWERPTRFAVKKNGAKRASRVYDSMAEAETNVKDGQTIELRPGSRVRCEGYCAVWKFCKQFEQYQLSQVKPEPVVA